MKHPFSLLTALLLAPLATPPLNAQESVLGDPMVSVIVLKTKQ